MIYFDNAASASPDPALFRARLNSQINVFGNPAGIHEAGDRARQLICRSKDAILSALNLPDSKVIMTSSATESNNLAMLGLRAGDRDLCVALATDHSSILEPIEQLRRRGMRTRIIDVDRHGQLDFEQMEAAVGPRTRIVSFCPVNNETGVIQKDWEKTVRLAHRHGCHVHGDMVQAVGHTSEIDFSLFDSITFSAHKLHGPKGVACLIIGRDAEFSPLLLGGEQEYGLRGGTEDPSAAYVLSLALKKSLEDARLDLVRGLRERLVDRLKTSMPFIRFNSPADGVPNILSVTIPGCDSDTVVRTLSVHGICVSGASACSNLSGGGSHVIRAMTGSAETARSTVRISLSKFNTAEECDIFTDTLSRITASMRN